jgi:hypothetical protein
MPISLLQNRVFHVLVVSARLKNDSTNEDGTHMSWTAQLPIDFDSFSDVPCIRQESYMSAKRRYARPTSSSSQTLSASASDDNGNGSGFKKEYEGKKLTEGKYVSLERLCKVSSSSEEGGSRWDMVSRLFLSFFLAFSSMERRNRLIIMV